MARARPPTPLVGNVLATHANELQPIVVCTDPYDFVAIMVQVYSVCPIITCNKLEDRKDLHLDTTSPIVVHGQDVARGFGAERGVEEGEVHFVFLVPRGEQK